LAPGLSRPLLRPNEVYRCLLASDQVFEETPPPEREEKQEDGQEEEEAEADEAEAEGEADEAAVAESQADADEQKEDVVKEEEQVPLLFSSILPENFWTKFFPKNKTRGRCYDHNFLRFLTNFGEKNDSFLKNQCYD
jgi:hypothetical protein